MKRKRLFMVIAVLLAAGGLWFARTAWRTSAAGESSTAEASSGSAGLEMSYCESMPGEGSNSRPRLAPPDPARKFMEFTPEQRVEFARRGHGPGG